MAQNNLGEMYANGRGVPKDYGEAIKWYRLAAAQGNAVAQSNLGLIYSYGRGVRRDDEEAVKWFRLAAAQGDPLGEVNLGTMYKYGQGVPQDDKEAVKWFRLAAEHYRLTAPVNVDAQIHLGWMYENGWGVPKDDKEAISWYSLAAELGNANAQTILGMMYGSGRGVRQDYVLSYMWFTLARAHLQKGEVSATMTPAQIDANLVVVALKMTPAQIDLAQKLARRCEKSNYKQCGEPQDTQFGVSATASVPMRMEGGTYVVPVLINGAITLDFVVDSGAADVSIPADVVSTLMRTKTLKETDFLGEQTYVLADGSKVPSQTFVIRSLKVGNIVLENVNGSVASVRGSLLLGQTFLNRFKSWSVDNTNTRCCYQNNQCDGWPLYRLSSFRPTNSGSLAMPAAIFLASSLVISFAAARRPGSDFEVDVGDGKAVAVPHNEAGVVSFLEMSMAAGSGEDSLTSAAFMCEPVTQVPRTDRRAASVLAQHPR